MPNCGVSLWFAAFFACIAVQLCLTKSSSYGVRIEREYASLPSLDDEDGGGSNPIGANLEVHKM